MKSVSLSQVVRSHDSFRFLCPIQSWDQLLSIALTLALGLTCIVMLFLALDPGAPVAYLVIPVLMGGLAPVFAALPARFEVVTRFHAHYFLKTLDRPHYAGERTAPPTPQQRPQQPPKPKQQVRNEAPVITAQGQ